MVVGLISALAAVTVSIFMGWLLNQRGGEARQQRDRRIIEYGTGHRRAVVIMWLVVALMLGALSFVPDYQDWRFIGGLAAFFGGLLALLSLETFIVCIEFDSDGLHTRSPWRWQRHIGWNDIIEVTHSRFEPPWCIHTRGQGKVRLSMHLSGLESLWSELRRRGHQVPSIGLKVAGESGGELK
jgi:hypothetical protein